MDCKGGGQGNAGTEKTKRGLAGGGKCSTRAPAVAEREEEGGRHRERVLCCLARLLGFERHIRESERRFGHLSQQAHQSAHEEYQPTRMLRPMFSSASLLKENMGASSHVTSCLGLLLMVPVTRLTHLEIVAHFSSSLGTFF
jgi:hypothetical protein